MKGIRRAFVFAIGVLAAGASFAQSNKGDPARGAEKAKACAACHGTGEREPLAMTPWLSGQVDEVIVLQLVLIREGLREVPQMAGLLDKVTDPDFFDIAAYYARQTPAKSASKPDAEKRSRGAALAKQMGCDSCHMSDYSGQKQVPRIANQREDYLVATLKAYRDNKRVPPDTSMLGIMGGKSDADIEALAHFISHQNP